MSVSIPERPHSFAGRIADRRDRCASVFRILLLMLMFVGCRTVGTSTVSTHSAVDEDTDSDRQVRPKAFEFLKRDKIAAKTKKRSGPAEKIEAQKSTDEEETVASEQPEDDRDDSSPTAKAPPAKPSRKSKTDQLADGSVNALYETNGSDARESLISILKFNNQDAANPAENPLDQQPRQLPSATGVRRQSRLEFPQEIPGANAPALSLPSTMGSDDPRLVKQKNAAIDILFPAPSSPPRIVTPTDRFMTLEELEDLALQNNPSIAQARASITMSQGTSIQAGMYPNPNLGYEADTVGSSGTRNYQGVYFQQPIKTANKLGLLKAAANMDLANAQLQFEKTELQVLHAVRARYYDVLISQESMRINEALVRFTSEVYSVMIDRLKGDLLAAYELSQLMGLVDQAKATLYQAQNQYLSVWKQLAVATGIPELPQATLRGRVDMPVPNLDFDALLEQVLSVYPDVHASRNMVDQARFQLRYQQVVPIGDISLGGAIQNDFTSPGFNRTSYNLQVSVPVPIWDRNLGNIRNAQGKLNLSSKQYDVVKNQLTGQLTDAFNRYQTGREYVEIYRNRILPNLARAYRGVYERHISSHSDKVAFGDIIVAQQNLAGGIAVYISMLSTQWIALTDIADLLQLRNFNELLTNAPDLREVPVQELPPAANPEGGQP